MKLSRLRDENEKQTVHCPQSEASLIRHYQDGCQIVSNDEKSC